MLSRPIDDSGTRVTRQSMVGGGALVCHTSFGDGNGNGDGDGNGGDGDINGDGNGGVHWKFE